jgi:hypothetical protein
MRLLLLLLAFALVLPALLPAASGEIKLPAFPMPMLVLDGGPPREISSVRLLRELHRGGLSGFKNFETSDTEYALFRSDALGNLGAWLETACTSVGFDLLQARTRNYDGTIFARLLQVGTSLAALREKRLSLAMPVGVLVCQRAIAWGDLPADRAEDAYVVFVTEVGMLIYDPPTRQLTSLSDFPNKPTILKIRF